MHRRLAKCECLILYFMTLANKISLKQIPGASMVLPLLAGALINTFWPSFLDIGGFTTGIARGATPLIGVFLFCMGAGINFKAAPKSIRQGAVVTFSKFTIGFILGTVVASFTNDTAFLGISSMAIIAAMTNTNGGLYAALAGEFGDETDVGSIAIISINDGPFLTMIALGAAGIAAFPLLSIIGVVLPVLLGVVVGNLNIEYREFLTKGGMALIPFFAFSLGCGIQLNMLVDGGFSGILLGLITVFIGGFFNIIADKVTGGSGVSGAAASSTAGNAVATPAAVALMDPSIQPLVGVATSQIAAAVITTAICTPFLTAYIARRNRK